jgi:small-conductance mechanosensitive channel
LVRSAQFAVSQRVDDLTARFRLRRGIAFFGYLIGVIVLVAAIGNGWGQLTVFFGVAGAGIAFALQEVIVSVAAWGAVSFGAFYRIGDRVKLGGITGDVIEIAVLRTTIMETGDWVSGDLYNGRVVRVANSFVFKEPVFNYSADFPFLWDELKLPVRYDCDWEKARSIFETAAKTVTNDLIERSEEEWKRFVQKYQVEKARVEPLVTMVVTGDWVEFTIRYITHFRSRRTTKDAISTLILKELVKHADTIQLGAATLELVGPMKGPSNETKRPGERRP